MQVEKVTELSELSPGLKEPGTVANLFATIIAAAFHIGIRISCRLEIIGLSNYTGSPSTIVVSNHKRDLDMLIIGPTLHFGDRFPHPLVRPCFAARDDEFAPSFLSTYYSLPRWLNRVILYRLDISPVMYAFRAHPLRQAHATNTNQALREMLQLEGDVELGTMVRESWLQRCADSLGIQFSILKHMKISDLMNWRYLEVLRQKAGPSMLQVSSCRRMRLFQVRAIRKQLECFAELLSQGKIIFLAPEGELSRDGRLYPIRGSLYRLVNLSRRAVKIQPINISYDFITTGRMKAFLNIGREIPDTKGLSKAELGRLIKDSLLKLMVVTMSQIGSYYLYHKAIKGEDTIIEEIWRRQLATLVQKAEVAGHVVDRALLGEQSFNRQLKSFMRYCVRKGYITRVSSGRLRINRERILDTSSTGYSKNPVYYCHNEFSTLLSPQSLHFLIAEE